MTAANAQKAEGTALAATPVKKPVEIFRDTIDRQKSEFLKVLPSHISYEKFQRTLVTACMNSPELLTADRQSLLVSCLKSASDGLVPDGRDAALVIFNSKGKDEGGKDVWFKKVQYLPMYAGILKKIRQSGDVTSIVTHVVYAADKFEYFLGDEEKIIHEPYLGDKPRGEIRAAYCIAKLKDGTIVREVMSLQDIEKVRRSSKAGDDNGEPKGIWKSWYEEMARKTVFRRCAKWLPQSIELVERMFEADDTLAGVREVRPDAPTVMIEDNSVIEQGPAEQEEKPKQPDLKKEVEAKKTGGSKKKLKTPAAETAKPKDETPPAVEEKKPTAAETKEEAAAEATIFEQIKASLEKAADAGTLEALFEVDYKQDLEDMSVADWKILRKIYEAKMQQFEKGE